MISYIFIFRKVKNHPIIILFYLYFCSAVSSIFLGYDYLKLFGWHPEDYSIWGYLLFAICNIVCLIPIVNLRDYSPLKQNFKVTKPLQFFLLFWFIFSVYSILYHLPYANKAVSNDVSEIRYLLNAKKESILPESLFTTFAVAVAAFYNVFIFLFFRILVSRPDFKKILLFCFVSSVTYVISSLTFGARDGLLFFVLSSVFAFILHKNALPTKIRKTTIRLVFVLAIAFTFLLGRFTYQRFIQKSKVPIEYALKIGVLGYFGQQPHVFNEAIWQHNKTEKFHGHALRFPLLAKVTGKKELPNRSVAVEWSFGSFLKDFYDINGLYSLIPLVLSFSIFFYYHFKRWRLYHPLRNIILISFYWQFLLSGLFFFNLGTFAGNVTIVVYLISFWCLKYIYPNKELKQING